MFIGRTHMYLLCVLCLLALQSVQRSSKQLQRLCKTEIVKPRIE